MSIIKNLIGKVKEEAHRRHTLSNLKKETAQAQNRAAYMQEVKEQQRLRQGYESGTIKAEKKPSGFGIFASKVQERIKARSKDISPANSIYTSGGNNGLGSSGNSIYFGSSIIKKGKKKKEKLNSIYFGR